MELRELKATELRIGNLVLNPHTNEESVITAKDIAEIESGVMVRVGLPITKYQLSKFKFTDAFESLLFDDVFGIHFNSESQNWQITLTTNQRNPFGRKIVKFIHLSEFMEVTYIHEIQNLYLDLMRKPLNVRTI